MGQSLGMGYVQISTLQFPILPTTNTYPRTLPFPYLPSSSHTRTHAQVNPHSALLSALSLKGAAFSPYGAGPLLRGVVGYTHFLKAQCRCVCVFINIFIYVCVCACESTHY